MKYKAGDKVIIKNLGTLPPELRGRTMEIKRVYSSYYDMTELLAPIFWTDELIEGIAEDDDKRFKAFLQSGENLNNFIQQNALQSFRDYVEIQAHRNEAVADLLQQISKYIELAPLVKQLREAEKEEACLPSHAYDDELSRKREGLQREIDKRIKELENAQAL